MVDRLIAYFFYNIGYMSEPNDYIIEQARKTHLPRLEHAASCEVIPQIAYFKLDLVK